MKLAMTVMVRDEADVISAMLDHHLRQGVDIIIVTDNGSVDGTAEILEGYAHAGSIDLRHDPVHRKQQGETVTRMARDAYTQYGADWVINADADEFWMPRDRSLTLHEAFDHISPDLRSFIVPVVDMTGPPALRGAGLGRLIYRDNRSNEQLRSLGLLAHSTHDSAHIGSPDVVVAQGNHYVSLASAGDPDPAYAIEVLHLPWRSWEQYRQKVENAGRAYENSDLKPSPNHHGMRDYQRLLAGTLFSYFVARHPDATAIENGIQEGDFTKDDVLAPFSAGDEVAIDPQVEALARADAAGLVALEQRAETAEAAISEARRVNEAAIQHLSARADAATRRVEELERLVQELRNRRVIRLIDGATERMRRVRPQRP